MNAIPDEISDVEALVRSLHYSYQCSKSGKPNKNAIYSKSGKTSFTRLEYSDWDRCMELAKKLDEDDPKKTLRSFFLLCAGYIKFKGGELGLQIKVVSDSQENNLAHAHVEFPEIIDNSHDLNDQIIRQKVDELIEGLPFFKKSDIESGSTIPKNKIGFTYLHQSNTPIDYSWHGPTKTEACRCCQTN